MYMTCASVAPENVRFGRPDLELPDVRELSAREIDAVSGGAKFLGIEIDFTEAAIVGGFTAFGGGLAGLGLGPVGTAVGVVGGFIGGFGASIGGQIYSQVSHK